MNRLFTYGLFWCMLISTWSCADYLDINKDPDALENVDESLLLPYALSSTGYVVGGRYQVLGALWSQHWTQSMGASQYAGLDDYDINSSTYNAQFGEMYAGSLQNYDIIKTRAYEKEHWGYYLIATSMQCYVFQLMTDLYDEIPFYDILTGENGNTTPTYASGETVYDSLIVWLDDALSKDLTLESVEDIGREDLLFNGDLDQWEAFANSLKLKILLRQCYARPSVSQAGLTALLDEDADVDFLNSDAVISSFVDEFGSRNPFYETDYTVFGNNPNLIISNTLLAYMQRNADDRLDAMFNTPQSGGAHKGLDQGNYNDPEEPSNSTSASFSKPAYQATYPVFLMSTIEVNLMRAEAMMRYNIGKYEDAKELYDVAVELAFSRYGLNNGDDYYNGGVYAFPEDGSPTENFVEAIMMQKWVALANFQSMETFFEHNRTKYPEEVTTIYDNFDRDNDVSFTISVNNVTNNRFPRRLVFPDSERNGNPNTPSEKPVHEKVWWDQKN